MAAFAARYLAASSGVSSRFFLTGAAAGSAEAPPAGGAAAVGLSEVAGLVAAGLAAVGAAAVGAAEPAAGEPGFGEAVFFRTGAVARAAAGLAGAVAVIPEKSGIPSAPVPLLEASNPPAPAGGVNDPPAGA